MARSPGRRRSSTSFASIAEELRGHLPPSSREDLFGADAEAFAETSQRASRARAPRTCSLGCAPPTRTPAHEVRTARSHSLRAVQRLRDRLRREARDGSGLPYRLRAQRGRQIDRRRGDSRPLVRHRGTVALWRGEGPGERAELARLQRDADRGAAGAERIGGRDRAAQARQGEPRRQGQSGVRRGPAQGGPRRGGPRVLPDDVLARRREPGEGRGGDPSEPRRPRATPVLGQRGSRADERPARRPARASRAVLQAARQGH